MGFVEKLSIIGGIGIVEDLLATSAAHPSRYQSPVRDTVDSRQFLGDAQRILESRQRISEQHDSRFLRDPRENRGLDVHHGAHAEGRPVMLVEHDCVEADVLGIDHFVKIFVVELRADFAIEKAGSVRQRRRDS